MRKFSTGLIIAAVLAVCSCQKEIDWGLGNGGAAAPLLVKISSKTGTDSSLTSYSYDAQRRLTRENVTGVSGGVILDNSFTINRNAGGTITNTVQKSAALAAAGIDSVVTRYYYNSSNSRYIAAAFDLTIGGFSVTDSAVYSYDGSGRITSDMHYIISGILPPIPVLQNQYTYTANGLNLTDIKQLASLNPPGPLSTVSTQNFSYDTKINPLLFRNESVILIRPGFFNANNSTRVVVDNTIDPSQNFTQDNTYKYNSNGMPDSSYSLRTPGGAITASKYFYQ